MKPNAPGDKKLAVRVQETIPIAQILADASNRSISERDEAFRSLCDSVRVLGVLQPPHVRRQTDGTFILVDGERRWRAAKACGLKELVCVVWEDDGSDIGYLFAALALNQERQPHSCIHVARRLQQIRNTGGYSVDELAKRYGMCVDRIKTYFALFGASPYLISFFENEDVPVKVAAEIMRFEKYTNEAKARQLVELYKKAPMGRHAIAAMRRQIEAKEAAGENAEPTELRRPAIGGRVKAALERDLKNTIDELRGVLEAFGFELVSRPHERLAAAR